MKLLLDWESDDLGHMGMTVPDHTRESLEHYFLKGWEPGGFLTAMLTGDLYRAVSSADIANRQVMWIIGRWITVHAPAQSWGYPNAVNDWCLDKDGRRTTWAREVEKREVWKTLSN